MRWSVHMLNIIISAVKLRQATISFRGTDWYYESQFVDSMPDLNLENEAVRAEIDKIVGFWIDRGVDGFRLDAVIHYNDSDETESIDDLAWLVSDIKVKGRCVCCR